MITIMTIILILTNKELKRVKEDRRFWQIQYEDVVRELSYYQRKEGIIK